MGGCAGKARRDDEDKLDFKGGNVHIITSKEGWDQKIAEANRDGKTVVANFSASWCGPCRVIAPVYAEMSKTYPQLMFLTIDVDDLMLIMGYPCDPDLLLPQERAADRQAGRCEQT
ncbi:hypothetical protein SEVIR_3G100000v4 [Setaria viridis]